ncbi:MAG: NADH-quinone oxidoreductase subunit M, partial [Candidatus Marinimicrobia bacterium]|nr:NADH-quinone oxidoreductase subunit M [Candidatus Neomarinimicrobiota bacterium]
MNEHLLSMNIFIPLLGILAITSASKKREDIVKIIAAITTGLQMWIALQIFFNFDRTKSGIQFVEHYSWIKTFSIDYFLGIDGLSFPLVLLTALILFISVFASWKLKKGVKGYFILFLLIDMGLMGVFTSMDLFLFLIFFGLTLFPTYLLIGIWGNSQSENTAIKYALFSVFSYVLILLGILVLYFKSNPNTFNILELIPNANFSLSFQIMTFLILFIGFAALIPIFPFHTWLISVLTKAPTAVSIIVVSILIKIGTYGLIRICLPILPSASIGFALPLSIIAIINIIYGALCALGQNDLKKIVGYFSISQMGFILLGFASVIGGVSGKTNAAITGISGSLFHMFN